MQEKKNSKDSFDSKNGWMFHRTEKQPGDEYLI